MKSKKSQKLLRHLRVRKKVSGSPSRPRLAVFRSNKYIYAQIIDDSQSKTLAFASDIKEKEAKIARIERATKVGKDIAKIALAKNIKKVIFDRGPYRYHGRIKALAEGAREVGLNF